MRKARVGRLLYRPRPEAPIAAEERPAPKPSVPARRPSLNEAVPGEAGTKPSELFGVRRYMDVSDRDPAADDQRSTLLALYDSAHPQVYGYLLHRCNSEPLAEDLTAETFLAAVDAVKRNAVPSLTVAWLRGVARHKRVDHWRRQAREERGRTSRPVRDSSKPCPLRRRRRSSLRT
jgi:hypothetical protein